jgi:hypothetical protein
MQNHCFACGVLLEPGEPALRLIWEQIHTALVHLRCAGAAIYHLHQVGDVEEVAVVA